jgi:hypothetical protein
MPEWLTTPIGEQLAAAEARGFARGVEAAAKACEDVDAESEQSNCTSQCEWVRTQCVEEIRSLLPAEVSK